MKSKKRNNSRKGGASPGDPKQTTGTENPNKVVNVSFSLPEKEKNDFAEFRESCKKTINVNGSELIRVLIIKALKDRNLNEIKSCAEQMERRSVGRKRNKTSPEFLEITDQQWVEISKILMEGKALKRAKNDEPNNPKSRRLLNGVLYKIKAEGDWRAVPEKYGNWQALRRNYNFLSGKKILYTILDYYFDSLKAIQTKKKEKAFQNIPMSIYSGQK